MNSYTTMAILLTALAALTVLISALAYKEAAGAKRIAQRALNTAQTERETGLRIQNSLMQKISELEAKIPDDLKEQHLRHDTLMSELNDELEKRIESERIWNDTVNSIMNFTGKATDGVNGNGR